jgi:DNA-binding transcriptional MerR regulator
MTIAEYLIIHCLKNGMSIDEIAKLVDVPDFLMEQAK